MKLNLQFKSEAGMYPVRGPRTNGQIGNFVQIMQKYASVDSQCGDRLMYKAVRMLSYALDEAGVDPEDSFDRAQKQLWNLYQRSVARIQSELAEKMSYVVNKHGYPWRLYEVPDTAKFPVQVTFEVRPGLWLCAALDEQAEMCKEEGQWILFARLESENCASSTLFGTCTGSLNGFNLKRFEEKLPLIASWLNTYGNSVSPVAGNSGSETNTGPITGQTQGQEIEGSSAGS